MEMTYDTYRGIPRISSCVEIDAAIVGQPLIGMRRRVGPVTAVEAGPLSEPAGEVDAMALLAVAEAVDKPGCCLCCVAMGFWEIAEINPVRVMTGRRDRSMAECAVEAAGRGPGIEGKWRKQALGIRRKVVLVKMAVGADHGVAGVGCRVRECIIGQP